MVGTKMRILDNRVYDGALCVPPGGNKGRSFSTVRLCAPTRLISGALANGRNGEVIPSQIISWMSGWVILPGSGS